MRQAEKEEEKATASRRPVLVQSRGCEKPPQLQFVAKAEKELRFQAFTMEERKNVQFGDAPFSGRT